MKKNITAVLVILGLLGITSVASAQAQVETLPMVMTGDTNAYILLDEGTDYMAACPSKDDPKIQTGYCHSVTAVEGAVIYREDGKVVDVDAAVGIQHVEFNEDVQGRVYYNNTGKWHHTEGYSWALDVAANSGEVYTLRGDGEKSSGIEYDSDLEFDNLFSNHLDLPKKNGNGPNLTTTRIDVDGNGTPYVVALDDNGHGQLFKLVDGSWQKLTMYADPDYLATEILDIQDIGLGDDGEIVVVADQSGIQYPQYNCIYTIDPETLVVTGGTCAIEFTRVDVDANGTIWAAGTEDELSELYKITKDENGLNTKKMYAGIEITDVGAQ